MQVSKYARPVARIGAVLVLTGLGILASCRDVTLPRGEPSDDWASDAVVSIRTRSEVQLFADGKRLPSSAIGEFNSRTLRIPSQFGATTHASLSRSGSTASVLRHIVDSKGNVRSLGIVFDDAGRPPKRLYLFENGRIQAIYSPKYARYGGGWIRKGAGLVLFGSAGTPVAHLRMDAVDLASVHMRRRSAGTALADAVAVLVRPLLPAPVLAQGIGPDCWREFIKVLGSEVTTISAALGTGLAASACAGTGSTLTLACVTALSGAGLTFTQIATLSENFDVLIKCELRSWIMLTNTTGGGSYLDPVAEPSSPADNTSVAKKTIAEFIDDAERSGTYWCSVDGSDCIYYAQ